METDAILTRLGYAPNDALKEQYDRIVANTHGMDKIQKHILDLHDVLKVDDSYVAMSNSNDYFKIKIEASSPERTEEAKEKIDHFAKKYKVVLKKVDDKETYYIAGFAK